MEIRRPVIRLGLSGMPPWEEAEGEEPDLSLRYRLIFALFLVPFIVFAFFFYGGTLATRAYMDEASLQAGSALRLAVSALSGHLSRYEPLPALIADHDDIKDLIAHPDDTALREAANLYLKEINALLESSDIYVMTLDGETIAASNYDRPSSFVGQNFSYRPYFQDAAKGRQSRFYALGTTSLKRGYYFASPIHVEGRISGVIVFKVDIDSIETSWRGGEYKIFVSDPEGIIFMTGSPEWLYSGILPLNSRAPAADAGLAALCRGRTQAAADHAQHASNDHELMTIERPRTAGNIWCCRNICRKPTGP